MDIESLKLLETRIDDILTQHAAVTAERDRLREQLAQTQARLDDTAAQLRQQEQERAAVKAHVERIMSRLDGLDLG